MKIIRNSIIPFKGYDAINVFGLLFCRKDAVLDKELINHERIHFAQMKELGFVFFYLWYLIEWLIRIPTKDNAYVNISFEREAYANMNDIDYLKKRRLYAWCKYLRNAKMK